MKITASSVNALREFAGTFAFTIAAKSVSQSHSSSSLALSVATQVIPIKEKKALHYSFPSISISLLMYKKLMPNVLIKEIWPTRQF